MREPPDGRRGRPHGPVGRRPDDDRLDPGPPHPGGAVLEDGRGDGIPLGAERLPQAGERLDVATSAQRQQEDVRCPVASVGTVSIALSREF
ncbi:hypothetical protein [Ornithinimicrobium kibberense]|uniref:hypothetical protein n=1 Tax=Ornithinimicrobium kibberense TaxID=282060 RepID=UPI00360C7761